MRQSLQLQAQDAETPKPKRINRAIELLEAGQPIYYTGGRGGYEEGKKMAATKADYINYEMEHGAFDMKELRDFMRGLVDAGPTRTGHRTPAVIVTLPILGKDPAAMRANYWVAQQVMAAGVHGILLCHAENPEAVKIFVESLRYPFAEKHRRPRHRHPRQRQSGLRFADLGLAADRLHAEGRRVAI